MRPSALSALLALGAMVTVACSMTSAESGMFGDGASRSPGDNPALGGSNEGTGAAAPDLAPTDNGVIMVHAAGMPAFRLCFENEQSRLPQPDSQVMPEANVVGVEVGSAVRIAPLAGPPGKVWIFEEPLIRDFSGKGSSCAALIGNASLLASAHEVPAITEDLSRGVHLLVVTGCVGKTPLRSYTKAECGEDYDETKPHGNIRILQKQLKGATRTGDALPSQVIHLAQPIEGARNGATLAVSFGDISNPGAAHTAAATAPPLFGDPLDLTPSPTFDGSNESIFAELGFRVTLTDGANPPTVIGQQSLADVQRLSAPRDLPATYYAAASNYVLLLLGDPAPKTADGGADDDPLRRVHLLAVPVIEPKADAGADGGDEGDAGTDGSVQ